MMTRSDLLEWLSKEDDSPLGECDGALLRRLVEDGLAHIREIKGMAAGYSRVSLTEAGRAAVKAGPMPADRVRAFAELRHDATVLEIVARAYDREDSAQRGEPDPWRIASEDPGLERQWREERLACALAAMEAVADYWRGLAAR